MICFARVVYATVFALAVVLGGFVSTGIAQDAPKINDIFKQKLAATNADQINVRTYDVPPGWATKKHHHEGHMLLYIVEGTGAMETEGEVRKAGPGQVLSQSPGKPMIMRNDSSTARLKFVLFQVGPSDKPIIVLEK